MFLIICFCFVTGLGLFIICDLFFEKCCWSSKFFPVLFLIIWICNQAISFIISFQLKIAQVNLYTFFQYLFSFSKLFNLSSRNFICISERKKDSLVCYSFLLSVFNPCRSEKNIFFSFLSFCLKQKSRLFTQ